MIVHDGCVQGRPALFIEFIYMCSVSKSHVRGGRKGERGDSREERGERRVRLILPSEILEPAFSSSCVVVTHPSEAARYNGVVPSLSFILTVSGFVLSIFLVKNKTNKNNEQNKKI